MPMTPTNIRKAMLDARCSLASIALTLGVTRGAVSNVVHGRRVSQRIREAVADAISKPYSEVWGDEPSRDGSAAPPTVNMYTTSEQP